MKGKTNVKIKPNKKIRYVKYIESTGTQYIDTGIVPKSTTRMVMEMAIVDMGESVRNGWGSSANAESFFCGYNSSTQTYDATVSDSWQIVSSESEVDMNKHTFDISNAAIIIDGVNYGEGNIGDTATAGQTMYLFGLHTEYAVTSNVYYSLHKERIYSCQIYDGETLLKDYRPCKDENGVMCFYEKVSKQYVYSATTENFIGDKYEPIPVKYLTNTGKEFIDTEIIITPQNFMDFKMEIDMAVLKVTEQTAIMGTGGDDSGNCVYVGVKNTNKWYYGNGLKDVSTELTYVTDRTLHVYDVPNLLYKIGNAEINMSLQSPTTSNTLYLFAHHKGIANRLYGTFELYGARFYFKNVLAADFIPAKDYKGNFFMYDRLNKKEFHNKGTGTFGGA